MRQTRAVAFLIALLALAARPALAQGTIAIIGTQQLPLSCTTGQSATYSSVTGVWSCASLATAGANSSITSMSGLTGAIATPSQITVGATGAAGISSYTFLSVETGSGAMRGIDATQISADTGSSRFNLFKARGTPGTEATVVTGDLLGRVGFWGYDSANYLNMGAITVTSTGTIAATRVPTTMTFATATDATPSVLTTALTLNAAQQMVLPGGQILDGTAANVTSFSNSTTAQKLRVYNTTATPAYLELFAENGTQTRINSVGTTSNLYLGINGGYTWFLANNGTFGPSGVNNTDLATSGVPLRTGYFGTSVVSPLLVPASAGVGTVGSAALPYHGMELNNGGQINWNSGQGSIASNISTTYDVSFTANNSNMFRLSNVSATPYVQILGGTNTASTPLLSASGTWNAAGVAFIGSTLAFTETASASTARYFQILGGASGATDEFVVGKGGTVTAAGQFLADPTAGYSFTGTPTNKMWLTGGAFKFDLGGAGQFQVLTGAADLMTDAMQLRFGAVGDVILRRQAAKVLDLGSATAGVALDASTDGTLWVKSFAAADTAILKANVVNATGGFQINGVAGATHAACSSSVTAITVTGGIITAITCTMPEALAPAMADGLLAAGYAMPTLEEFRALQAEVASLKALAFGLAGRQ